MITLKTLPTATAQEVFDQVAKHMLKQQSQSMRGGSCAYRGSDGKMCAAGCLIADDEYNSGMDGGPAEGGRQWDSLVNDNEVPIAHQNLIEALQAVHDGADPEREGLQVWISDLIDIAKDYDLNADVLTTAA